MEGDDMVLRCSVWDTLQTLGGCLFIQSYLIKNGTVVQLKPFNATRMEVEFTVKDVALKDSGHYSCVVLPSKCIKVAETAFYGNNSVFLEVEGERLWWRWRHTSLVNSVIISDNKVYCGPFQECLTNRE